MHDLTTYTHAQALLLDEMVHATQRRAYWAGCVHRGHEAQGLLEYWAVVADHHALRLTWSLAGLVELPADAECAGAIDWYGEEG